MRDSKAKGDKERERGRNGEGEWAGIDNQTVMCAKQIKQQRKI